MKLKLSKDVVENNNLSNNAFISYIGLMYCCRFDYEPTFINRSMISYYLTGKRKLLRRFDESLKQGLQELIDKNIVACLEQNKNNYYFGFKNIKLNDDDKFVFVDFDDIRKIMECDYKGKIALLRFYVVLLGTFICKNYISDIRNPDKYNNIMGMMSQEYVANLADVSVHSVIEYTKILEELNLLYVSRCSFMFKDSKGNIKRHNNIYGRYENKDIIDEFTKIRYEMYDDLHKVHMSSASNNSRSLMQKYNQMVKGKTYSKEVMDNIYNYINQYNKKYPNKCKNMDVFMKYGYNVDLD